MKARVLVTNPLSDVALVYLQRRCDVTVDYGLDEHGLLKKIKHFDGLIVRSATPVRSCVLTDGVHACLRVVATATAGYNHVNTDTARKLGIPVVYSPWGNTLANAEFIIGSMIVLARNIARSDRYMRAGVWDQEAGIGPELYGKVFGTIGFGRIGGLTAEKAKLLGMKVIAYDPGRPHYEFETRGVRRVSLHTLLRQADFVSLSVPFSQRTKGLLGKKELSLMKPTAYIIQSSRGGTIDEDALLKALSEEKIRGAAIDVFVDEPVINPLFRKMNHVVLTPHIGCSSQESRVRSGLAVARDVLSVLNGRKATNLVPA
ncbi:MAG: hydroxyacid dehydrogenase [Patescibacteria group bacterium]